MEITEYSWLCQAVTRRTKVHYQAIVLLLQPAGLITEMFVALMLVALMLVALMLVAVAATNPHLHPRI
jgi:hypothetical protein